jgi:hypothetical protein
LELHFLQVVKTLKLRAKIIKKEVLVAFQMIATLVAFQATISQEVVMKMRISSIFW